MALKPITELIDALKALALPGVPAARIGEISPKAAGDLPTVRVVVSELAFSPLGIGGSRIAYLDASDNLVEDRGRRIKGALNLEVWGADEDSINAIALAAAEGLAGAEPALLGKGFLRLRQSRWQAAAEAPLRGTTNRTALKLVLAFEIVFEDVVTASAGEGPIREIEVRIQPPVEEGFDVA